MRLNLFSAWIASFFSITGFAGIPSIPFDSISSSLPVTQVSAQIEPFTTYPMWTKVNDGNLQQAISVVNVEGVPLYLCRSQLFNNLLPGEIHGDGCLITYAGKAFMQQNYEVALTNETGIAKWVYPGNLPQKEICATSTTNSGNSVSSPSYVISGKHGISLALPLEMPKIGNLQFIKTCHNETLQPLRVGNENGQSLSACLAIYKQSFHVGKLIGQECAIGYGGDEIHLPPYQILYYQDNGG